MTVTGWRAVGAVRTIPAGWLALTKILELTSPWLANEW